MNSKLRRSILYLLGAFLVCSLGIPAYAQAILGTENCKSVSSTLSFEVVAETDSPLDRSVKDQVEELFGALGMRPSPNPTLRILYRSEIEQIQAMSSRGEMVEAHSKSWEGNEVFVHLWRSNANSVIGGVRGERPFEKLTTYLRFVLEVSDANDLSCVWHGRAISILKGWRKEDLLRQIIPPLINRFGKSVTRENIILK